MSELKGNNIFANIYSDYVHANINAAHKPFSSIIRNKCFNGLHKEPKNIIPITSAAVTDTDDAATHSASQLLFTDTHSGKTPYCARRVDGGRLPEGNTEVEGYQSDIFIK